MPKSFGMVTVAYSVIWLQFAGSAMAQGLRPFDAAPYTNPTVSPYLNLGINQYGVSNYQSLVKPMIEDREALANQSINIQRLQQQLRDSKPNQKPANSSTKDSRPSAGSVRFMHYSHYFNRLP